MSGMLRISCDGRRTELVNGGSKSGETTANMSETAGENGMAGDELCGARDDLTERNCFIKEKTGVFCF